MSDFFAPSYWYGAGPGAAFSSVNNAVAQNQANMIPNMNANMAYVQAQAPTQQQLYGGGSFGAQPSYYAGLGAAYGRATGGFGGYSAPGGGGGGSVFDTGADPWNPYASQLAQQSGGDFWSRNAPSSGVIGGWYDPYGGGGGYSQPQAAAPRQPVSQDWNSAFNTMTAGNSYNPYELGGASWYPSQRSQPAAPDYSAWYGGLPGGSQAYNSWNMGLPAQGGFGVPGSGSGGGSWLDMYNAGHAAAIGAQQGGGGAWATGTPAGTRSAVPDVRTYMPSGQFGGYLDHYLWGANSGNLGRSSGLMGSGTDTASLGGYPFGGYVPQGGANDPWNPYAAQLAQQGGGVGSDARYGGQNALAGYGAALDMLRGGQGWTIAQQPQAVSQEMLGNRINQSIYDLGNAGDYYSRSIGGGFGMNMPSQSQGLTAQDLAAPHAYPGGFRMDQQ